MLGMLEGTQPKKLSAMKSHEDRRYFIEDAARTFKRYAEMKREIKHLKKDLKLMKAVKAVLAQEVKDIQSVKNTT